MGIKHFFSWFRKNFKQFVYNNNFPTVDTLLIDLNGIIHSAGNSVYSTVKPLMRKVVIDKNIKQKEHFNEIGKEIERLVDFVNPSSSIIVCIDGPAPRSKQYQQRQRRFKAISESTFDRNSITPGTHFMDSLTSYLDFFFKFKLSTKWKNLEIIFSNDRIPGEGEHKLLKYVRENKSKTYILAGQDSDLVMLGLATHLKKFYVIREEFNSLDYMYVDIGALRSELYNLMKWNDDCDIDRIINDFIFLCFMVGNDFIPHIPCIEIKQGGIENIFAHYKVNCCEYSYITKNGKIRKKSLKYFLAKLSENEKEIIMNKRSDETYVKEENVEKNIDENGDLDFKNYKSDYYSSKFNTTKKEIVYAYLQGLEWILEYYMGNVMSWNWIYPYNYGPFASDITKYIMSFESVEYKKSKPMAPFKQLISVLPKQSFNLLPIPLNKLFNHEKLKKYFPSNFKVDVEGKREEWEGIVLIDTIDINVLNEVYDENIDKIEESEIKRNKFQRCRFYTQSDLKTIVKSKYGEFTSSVKVVAI